MMNKALNQVLPLTCIRIYKKQGFSVIIEGFGRDASDFD